MIVFYIRSVESNTLANRGYAEQKGWPGLFLETSSICKHLDIADVNSTRLSKIKYKPTLNEAFHRRTKKKIETAGKLYKMVIFKEKKIWKKEYLDNQNNVNTRNWFNTCYRIQPIAEEEKNLKTEDLLNWIGFVVAR